MSSMIETPLRIDLPLHGEKTQSADCVIDMEEMELPAQKAEGVFCITLMSVIQEPKKPENSAVQSRLTLTAKIINVVLFSPLIILLGLASIFVDVMTTNPPKKFSNTHFGNLCSTIHDYLYEPSVAKQEPAQRTYSMSDSPQRY